MVAGAAKKRMADPKSKRCKYNFKSDSLKGIRQDCFKRKARQSTSSSSLQMPINLQSSEQNSVSVLTHTSSLCDSSTSHKAETIQSKVIENLILWTLDVGDNHYLLRSAKGNGEVFQEMFPNS